MSSAPAQSNSLPIVHLNQGVRHRILSGHPWVYKSEVDSTEGDPEDGSIVEIRGPRGQFLGRAIFNSLSQIVCRRYTLTGEEWTESLIAARLKAAVAYRTAVGVTADARRLVWSESDGLPGLIIDQYGKTVVLQCLTLAISKQQTFIAEWCRKNLAPDCLIARNDAPVRELEGLPTEKEVLYGKYAAPTPLEFGGVQFHLDLWTGHKTGFYLDQMDNYARVADHAAGRDVLDCFTNQGAFGLLAAKAGAKSCLAIDQSEEAIATATATGKRHQLNIQFKVDNVFDFLRDEERGTSRYDLIILDPPSFTKTKARVDSALRGYKDIHLRALRLLRPGGLLATFCCSHHIGELEWRGMLEESAAESRVSLRLRERLGQGRDHPILIPVPETEYLRGCLLEKMG